MLGSARTWREHPQVLGGGPRGRHSAVCPPGVSQAQCYASSPDPNLLGLLGWTEKTCKNCKLKQKHASSFQRKSSRIMFSSPFSSLWWGCAFTLFQQRARNVTLSLRPPTLYLDYSGTLERPGVGVEEGVSDKTRSEIQQGSEVGGERTENPSTERMSSYFHSSFPASSSQPRQLKTLLWGCGCFD